MMATPLLWSLDDPPFHIDLTRRIVRAQPQNWRQYGGDPVSADAQYLYNWWLDGTPVYNVEDPPQRMLSLFGLGNIGRDQLDYSALNPGTYEVRFQVLCATHSPAFGNEPEWWEIGRYHNNEPDKAVYVNFPLIVPPKPAPDPAPTRPTPNGTKAEARLVLDKMVQEWRRLKVPEPAIFNTVIYKCLKALDPNLDQKTRERIVKALQGVL